MRKMILAAVMLVMFAVPAFAFDGCFTAGERLYKVNVEGLSSVMYALDGEVVEGGISTAIGGIGLADGQGYTTFDIFETNGKLSKGFLSLTTGTGQIVRDTGSVISMDPFIGVDCP